MFPRGKMGMLTVIILMLMKGTDGPPVTMLPNTGLPPVTMIKACVGENKLLVTKDESAGDILTYEWTFQSRDASITTNYEILCQKTTSGGFEVKPSYSSKIEQCDTAGLLLKNISLDDMGYYKLLFLQEKMGNTESLTVFLAVSDTPTQQCKPVIRNHYRNMLNCSTPCGHIDVEWRLNKGRYVVGNESILPIDCLWKNEAILCCLQSKAKECYKGNELELCTQTTPSYCTENSPGENGYDIHGVKAPSNANNSLLGLLALLIVLGIPVLCYFHWNKIKSWIMKHQNRKNKSTTSNDVNTQGEDVNLLKEKEESKFTPTIEVEDKPVFTPNAEVKEESKPTPTIKMKEESKHVPTVEVQEESKYVPTVEVQEESKHVPTVEVKEESKSVPSIEVEESKSVTTIEVKKEPESTPTQLFNAKQVTKEETTEHQPCIDSETMKEVLELRDASLCKICFANKMIVFFMPCNHIATCVNCSIALKQCPVCRTLIEKKMNICFG